MSERLAWGIDPSIRHPVLAEWPTRRIWRLPTEHDGARRLAFLAVEWERLIREQHTPSVEAVFIERARGKFPKDALTMAIGVIEAVSWRTLAELNPYPTPIFELSAGEWKAEALGPGHGAAKKADVSRWALAQLPDRDRITQDEADALAIACAGSRMLAHDQPTLEAA